MALNERMRAGLAAIAGPDNVHTDPVSLLAYARDAGLERGRPEAVALPGDAEQVRALVAWANEQGLPVTGWGAGTGQTGGAVAAAGGLVISFARMRRIVALDAEAGQAVIEPGLITEHLDRAARRLGLTYPPDPASGSASSLGGNIAENAGGPRCAKYGVTSHYVLGLDTVLAGGRVATWGGPALDPPEPNFLDVLIGSEGTLALVTAARLRLVPLPEATGTMLATFRTPEDAAAAVSAVIRSGLRPAALEMLDGLLFSAVERSAGMNLTPGAGALLIADVEGYAAGLAAKVHRLEALVRPFDPLEVRLATSEVERAAIWYARKSAFAATAWIAPDDCSMDVVVPRSQLPQAFASISVLGRAAGFRVGYLSHAGDGNIHPEIFCDLAQPGVRGRVDALQDEIIRYVVGLGGSISGEHGIGLEKQRHLALMYGPAELAAMMDVKAAFDPAGRLNPGKIFPEPAAGEHQPGEYQPGEPEVRPYEGPSPLRPSSAEELAALLADLQDRRQPAWLGGGGTKCTPGGWLTRRRGDAEESEKRHCDASRPEAAEKDEASDPFPSGGVVRITTAGLNAILDRSYDDFYITVGSGAKIAEVAAALAADGYLLPLAAPWPGATIGGTVAAHFNAPWRGLYGGIRETLLAADVVLPDGGRLRLGRPLGKDVAGYSLHKLFIGAFGSLGSLAAVSLRIYPQPPARRSWAIACPDLATAIATSRIFGRLPGLVSALLLVAGGDLPAVLPPAPYQVIATLEGPVEDVEIAGAQVRRDLAASGLPDPVEPETEAALPAGGMTLWAEILRPAPWLLRAGVPPAGLPALLAAAERTAPTGADPARSSAFVADLAHSLLYLPGAGPAAAATDWETALRDQAETAGGYALALGPGLCPPRGLRVSPAARGLLAELKRRWDPAGILNAGIFGQEPIRKFAGEPRAQNDIPACQAERGR